MDINRSAIRDPNLKWRASNATDDRLFPRAD